MLEKNENNEEKRKRKDKERLKEIKDKERRESGAFGSEPPKRKEKKFSGTASEGFVCHFFCSGFFLFMKVGRQVEKALSALVSFFFSLDVLLIKGWRRQRSDILKMREILLSV